MTATSGFKIYYRLLTYVRPYWMMFVVSMIGFLIYASTQPMNAWIMKYTVDLIEHKNQDSIVFIPLLIVGIIFVRGIGSFLGNYYLAKVSSIVVHVLRCRIFDWYTVLPTQYFDDRSSGHLISRITYNVAQVTGAATDALKIATREGLTVIALLGYLFYLNWKLSLIFLAIMPAIALVATVAGKRFKKISKKIQLAMGDLMHIATELISGYRVVRSFGGESYERKRFAQASMRNYKQSLKMVKTAAIHTPMLQLIVGIALSILVFIALTTMVQDSSTGDIVAYLTAAIFIPKPIRQLSGVSADIQKGIVAAQSIFEVLDEEAEADNGHYQTERVQGRLDVRGLSFAYPNTEKQILADINFTAKPGQTIALVGYSGGGKTTLVGLFPRFYDYKQGKIYLDGVDIRDFTLNNLRQQISLVSQNIILFNDTIERNIAYGALAGINRKLVISAAEAANAMEFINEMPNGLDTIIGEDGIKLSGGQRQRLAIARALLKNAPLLILDEATSALDSKSEKKIQHALENAMQGRTTIVIAHRLSTIENADVILVMDKGRVVEKGNHQELILKRGHYANLHQSKKQGQNV